jgi:hypothetical protein
MTDLFVGATAGLSSSASIENAVGQAGSGTQTIIPLCHVPTKSTDLLAMALIRASLDLSYCVAERLYLLALRPSCVRRGREESGIAS